MSDSQKMYTAVFIALVVVLGIFFFGPTGLFSITDILGGAGTSTERDFSNNASRESGLMIREITEGTGDEAQAGDRVSVHYVGRFENGDVFDSSVEGEDLPLVFTLGTESVIAGFDQGIVGMKVGGRRELTIPPELAYGSTGVGPIPPNATLVFEVMLTSINQGTQ